MLSWYDGLCLCIGDKDAYDLLEWANSDDVSERAAPFKLTAPELVCLRAYTLHRGQDGVTAFQRINGTLRHPRGYARTAVYILPVVAHINSALAKLPAHRGLAYRYTTLPGPVLERMREGGFRDGGFLSASRMADRFEHPDLMIVRSREGRLIEQFSAYPDECEVLFRPNTAFDVTRLEETGSNVIVIMNEV